MWKKDKELTDSNGGKQDTGVTSREENFIKGIMG